MTQSISVQSIESHPRWNWQPPRWMNAFMTGTLKMPVMHRMLSGSILLIEFTGRKSGRTYTTPVSYARDGDSVLILTKRFRSWWRNFANPAPVTVTLCGERVTGTATALTDPAELLPHMAVFFSVCPRDANFYGLEPAADGTLPADQLAILAPKIVGIRIDLANR